MLEDQCILQSVLRVTKISKFRSNQNQEDQFTVRSICHKGGNVLKYKQYQKYKDSGVEWIGEIPEHWEVKRLKFVCQLNYGDSLQKENKFKVSKKIIPDNMKFLKNKNLKFIV